MNLFVLTAVIGVIQTAPTGTSDELVKITEDDKQVPKVTNVPEASTEKHEDDVQSRLVREYSKQDDLSVIPAKIIQEENDKTEEPKKDEKDESKKENMDTVTEHADILPFHETEKDSTTQNVPTIKDTTISSTKDLSENNGMTKPQVLPAVLSTEETNQETRQLRDTETATKAVHEESDKTDEMKNVNEKDETEKESVNVGDEHTDIRPTRETEKDITTQNLPIMKDTTANSGSSTLKIPAPLPEILTKPQVLPAILPTVKTNQEMRPQRDTETTLSTNSPKDQQKETNKDTTKPSTETQESKAKDDKREVISQEPVSKIQEPPTTERVLTTSVNGGIDVIEDSSSHRSVREEISGLMDPTTSSESKSQSFEETNSKQHSQISDEDEKSLESKEDSSEETSKIKFTPGLVTSDKYPLS